MKSAFILALVLLMIVAAVPVDAAENEYGIVKAWFNGKNATVKGFSMKVGEPGEIKVIVTSKTDANVNLELNEPGVTKAFDVIKGPSVQDKTIDIYDVKPGWSETFIWTVAPNTHWTNGNAPIDIFVQFYNKQKKNSKYIEFTIANPYILDEQYEGAVPTPEKITEVPETISGAGEQSKSASFPYMYLVLIGAVIVVVLVLFKLRK